MIDRPNPPAQAHRNNRWLSLGLGLTLVACSGKRFSAVASVGDAAVPVTETSSNTSATDELNTNVTTGVVSMPLNSADQGDGGSNGSSLDASVTSAPTDPQSEGSGTDGGLGTSTGRDASLSDDTPTEPSDAGVTDTSESTSSEPDDGGVPEQTSDTQPLYPCDDGQFGTPREVRGLGFSNNLWGPGISGDGKQLYFGHTEGDEDLFVAQLDGSDPTSFDVAEPLSSLNTRTSEGTPFVTANGLSIYFYATREGGPGDRDLWHASRQSIDAAFDNPSLVEGPNDENYDHLPWVSADELTLCYTTLRDDGLGQSDIWMATRESKDDAFGVPTLVPGINTEAREDAVAFSPDGLTVFFSTDRDTNGDLDIWHATRGSLEEEFTDAHAIAGLNSDTEDTNLSLTNDGRHLYFSSGRSGEQRIWVSSRTCAAPN